MTLEQERSISMGNVHVQFDETELRIGLVDSLLRKRDTFYLGLVSFNHILNVVERMLGHVPVVTVGLTNKRMAKFAQRRFGMDIKLVPRTVSGDYVYQVSGSTRQLQEQVCLEISDVRRVKRLKRRGLI